MLNTDACTQHMQRSIAEDAPKNGLIDSYRLNFVHIHFPCSPANESALADHPAVRDGNLGRPLIEPSFECQDGRHDDKKDSSKCDQGGYHIFGCPISRCNRAHTKE